MTTQTLTRKSGYCINCGKALDQNQIECPACGKAVSTGTIPPAADHRSTTGKSAGDWVFIGDQQLKYGHVEKAIEAFTNSIEVNPNLTTAYARRKKAYQAQGQTELAIADQVSIDAVISSRQSNPGISNPGTEESNPGGRMVSGLLWMVGGALATGITYAMAEPGGMFFVFYGAVLWGAFDFIRGFFGLFNS